MDIGRAVVAVALLIGVGCSSDRQDRPAWTLPGVAGDAETTVEASVDTGGADTFEQPDDPDTSDADAGGPADVVTPVTPEVDYYVVVDGDGPEEYRNAVRSFVDTFGRQVQTTDLVHRFGLTNMHPDNGGRLFTPQTWHRNPGKLIDALEAATFECTDGGDWTCPAEEPRGPKVAHDGIRRMSGEIPPEPSLSEQIRSEARLVVVFITDQPAASDGEAVEQYVPFFDEHATVYAITPRTDCSGEVESDDYKTMAVTTGGKYANVCNEDPSQLAIEFVLDTLPSAN